MNQELSPLSRMMLKLLVVDMSRQVLVEVTEHDWGLETQKKSPFQEYNN